MGGSAILPAAWPDAFGTFNAADRRRSDVGSES